MRLPNLSRVSSSLLATSLFVAFTAALLAPRASALADTDKGDAKEVAAVKPIASDKIKDGLVVEVWRLFRSSDGLTEVQWAYRNPTEKRQDLFNGEEARELASQMYLVDGKEKKKYHVCEVGAKSKDSKAKKGNDAALMVSDTKSTTLEPGVVIAYWAKFPSLPEATKEVTLYLPNAAPLEDLEIGARPERKAPEGESASAGDQPLAVERGPNGLAVEVTRLRRTSEGLLDVRWQYVNRTSGRVDLFNGEEARQLPAKLFVEDPDSGTRYLVATDDKNVPLMTRTKSTTIDAGGSENLWAKFTVPADAKHISLYLPGALPIEDLTIPEKK